jgi:hypothetical protein
MAQKGEFANDDDDDNGGGGPASNSLNRDLNVI